MEISVVMDSKRLWAHLEIMKWQIKIFLKYVGGQRHVIYWSASTSCDTCALWGSIFGQSEKQQLLWLFSYLPYQYYMLLPLLSFVVLFLEMSFVKISCLGSSRSRIQWTCHPLPANWLPCSFSYKWALDKLIT